MREVPDVFEGAGGKVEAVHCSMNMNVHKYVKTAKNHRSIKMVFGCFCASNCT